MLNLKKEMGEVVELAVPLFFSHVSFLDVYENFLIFFTVIRSLCQVVIWRGCLCQATKRAYYSPPHLPRATKAQSPDSYITERSLSRVSPRTSSVVRHLPHPPRQTYCSRFHVIFFWRKEKALMFQLDTVLCKGFTEENSVETSFKVSLISPGQCG